MNRTGQACLICLAWTAFLAACGPAVTVEQKIIGVINDMEARAEAGERRPFMDHVAADFRGQDGIVSWDQLNALVLYQMHRNRRVQAQLFPIIVTSDQADRAEASFHMLLTGGSKWIPERGRMLRVSTRWQLRDGDWVLVGANWSPVELDSVLE